jgi:endonuclease YncB( thermonuclease family)
MPVALLMLLVASLAAVEEGPGIVLRVVDGTTVEVLRSTQREGSTANPDPVRVRLLYIAIPDESDREAGHASPAGEQAKRVLEGLLPPGAEVMLTAPGEAFEHDPQGRLLALVHGRTLLCYHITEHKPDGSIATTKTIHWPVQYFLIGMGWSPYWTKHGEAPAMWDSQFREAQQIAQFMKAGAWATAPAWMRARADERPGP